MRNSVVSLVDMTLLTPMSQGTTEFEKTTNILVFDTTRAS